tara:strand:+ start:1038 stop:2021 length:984 start_codon:yes stop_codon:yes gene_type:complete
VNRELLNFLRCPNTGEKLFLSEEVLDGDLIFSGILQTKNNSHKYYIKDYIPRFVDNYNYAENFGKQWNKFRFTQLDSHSKTNISASRFWKATGLDKNNISNKLFLDVGTGAGRFAEVVLNKGGTVVALDFSSSVDAAFSNLRHFKNFHIVQADIYAIPFKYNTFDVIYSLGVLQHTPNVELAFKSLPKFLKTSGFLCTDFYWKRLSSLFHAKYLVRPITKRINQDKLFSFLENNISLLLYISTFLKKIPFLGNYLMRLIPVANYTDVYPLSRQQLKEWALLDTFDMLAPKYDSPQDPMTIKKWMKEEGFINIELLHANLLVIRGKKK